jgi:putative transcription factor
MVSFCELCGKQTEDKKKVMVENSVFNVCMACSKRGKPYVPASQGKTKAASTSFVPRGKPKRIELIDDTVLDPEYPRLIKEARIRLGLSHEQLGIKMNEKAILLRRFETGALKPDEAFSKKLERYLDITLYKSIKEED